MGRRLKGIRRQSWGVEIYVKVNGKQYQRTVASTLTDREIKLEREKLRLEKTVVAAKPIVRGSLRGDVERFLKRQQGRRKIDFQVHLAKWVDRFGDFSRGAITENDCKVAFFEWQREDYAASTLNHIRQVAITLWKWCDGPGAVCPVKQIEKFEEPSGRRGFFEHSEYLRVREHLRPEYQDLLDFVYHSGWRHAEVRDLPWSEVDLVGGVIILSPDRSKNDEGRVLPIDGVIKDVIERRQKVAVEGLPVFHVKIGDRQQAITNWRKAWMAACKAAGLEGKLIHDCRRTVVRNLVRAGVSEKVAMTWTGHKTRAVFDRYNIVNERDLRDASQRLRDHLKEKHHGVSA